MEIKKYQESFLAATREVYLESTKTTFTWLDTDILALLDFERDTEGEQIWVALVKDEIVGFISVWEPENFIHHLYVATAHQSKGVGRQLLEVVKSKYDNLSLKCMLNNKMAINFYESQGFIRHSKASDSLGDYYLMKFDDIFLV